MHRNIQVDRQTDTPLQNPHSHAQASGELRVGTRPLKSPGTHKASVHGKKPSGEKRSNQIGQRPGDATGTLLPLLTPQPQGPAGAT